MTKEIIAQQTKNWILVDGHTEKVFSQPECTQHKTATMKADELWAYVGETLPNARGGAKYFVNQHGQMLRIRNGKAKVFTWSSKQKQWRDARRIRYGQYVYTYVGAMHRLVAYAFLGDPPSSKHEVDHIDGNPANNEVSNLRWVTHSENISNKIRLVRLAHTCVAKHKVIKKPISRFQIVQYSLDMSQQLAKFKTFREAAAALGISTSAAKAMVRQTKKGNGKFKKSKTANFWLRRELLTTYEDVDIIVKK